LVESNAAIMAEAESRPSSLRMIGVLPVKARVRITILVMKRSDWFKIKRAEAQDIDRHKIAKPKKQITQQLNLKHSQFQRDRREAVSLFAPMLQRMSLLMALTPASLCVRSWPIADAGEPLIRVRFQG
jgi:hypothetical protein